MAIGQEARDASWKEVQVRHEANLFLVFTGMDCTETLWDLHRWRQSKPNWT